MKRILILTCIGSLALTLTALGAHKGKSAHRSSGGKGARSAHVVSARGGGHHVSQRVSQHASAPRHIATRHKHAVARASYNSRSSHGSHVRAAQINRNGHTARGHTRAAANRGRNAARTHNERNGRTSARAGRTQANARIANRGRNAARTHNERSSRAAASRARTEQANARVANRARNSAQTRMERNRQATARKTGRTQAAQTNVANAARHNLAENRGRNMTLGTNHVVNYNGQNVRIVNDWHEPRFRNNANYAAFYNYNNNYEWHDRSWWNDHYSRVVFVLGGWWYWNAGYWYPAWGYDPYASYVYAGPIYTSSAELTPHQIVANVQVALRDWGYNPGPVDGILGPETRAAIAAFQTNEGLLVTSAIDRPTLQTLGLT